MQWRTLTALACVEVEEGSVVPELGPLRTARVNTGPGRSMRHGRRDFMRRIAPSMVLLSTLLTADDVYVGNEMLDLHCEALWRMAVGWSVQQQQRRWRISQRQAIIRDVFHSFKLFCIIW